jgi:hypothetical protein
MMNPGGEFFGSSRCGQTERCCAADLDILNMAGLAVVVCLKVDVYVAVTGRKNATRPHGLAESVGVQLACLGGSRY